MKYRGLKKGTFQQWRVPFLLGQGLIENSKEAAEAYGEVAEKQKTEKQKTDRQTNKNMLQSNYSLHCI